MEYPETSGTGQGLGCESMLRAGGCGRVTSTATTASTGSRGESGWTKGGFFDFVKLGVGICGTETEKRQ